MKCYSLTNKEHEESLFLFLKVLVEMSNFAKERKGFYTTTSAEGYEDEKFMRIPRVSGLRLWY